MQRVNQAHRKEVGKDEIVFTADTIEGAMLVQVHKLQIPVNTGSVDMLEQLRSRHL